MNKADSERLGAYLESLGFQLADQPQKADLIALVTCGVRQSAEDRIYGLVPRFKKKNPQVKIILTGCLSDRPDVRERLGKKVDVYFNIADLPHLATKLGLKAEVGSNQGYLNLDAKYQSTYSAYVPIGNGCNNFCSYCVVPYARGREIYRPHQEILAEVKRLLAKGYKEIILIAQNVNSYQSAIVGSNSIIDFADLLKMIDSLEGDFWIRFSTSHPKDLSLKLIKTVARGQKICQHFHVALQSGDNEILKAMNRKYTVEHFLSVVENIRSLTPIASITTDIIVGFPGEGAKQFANTKKLMKKIGFAMAYIAQYSPRPLTVANKLIDNVKMPEKRRREIEINNLLKTGALKFNRQFVGQTIKVLVSDIKRGLAIGKNQQFVTIKFPSSNKNLIGQFVEVKIIEAQDFGLNGIVNQE